MQVTCELVGAFSDLQLVHCRSSGLPRTYHDRYPDHVWCSRLTVDAPLLGSYLRLTSRLSSISAKWLELRHAAGGIENGALTATLLPTAPKCHRLGLVESWGTVCSTLHPESSMCLIWISQRYTLVVVNDGSDALLTSAFLALFYCGGDGFPLGPLGLRHARRNRHSACICSLIVGDSAPTGLPLSRRNWCRCYAAASTRNRGTTTHVLITNWVLAGRASPLRQRSEGRQEEQ